MLPPNVNISDGLTQDEAVAIALWNNPDFQVQLANLGFARADLVEAGLLQNPVLSLLFPLGPKQLEATLRWPIELLWQRPRRVAAARLAAESIASGLEQDGLTLVSDVKLAYTEYALAQDRIALAERALTELNAVAALMDSRFQAGDISQLEARTAAIDAARARQDVDARASTPPCAPTSSAPVSASRSKRRTTPLALTPVTASWHVRDHAGAARRGPRVASRRARRRTGDRSSGRPSRLGELARAGDYRRARRERRGDGRLRTGAWHRCRAADLQPQPGRHHARPGRAPARRAVCYLAARQRVATEVRAAAAQYQQASVAAAEWRTTVLEPLEEQVQVADRAFNEGEVAYLFVIEMNRRLTDARLRTREAEADIARALARLERAVGRRCSTEGERTRWVLES